MGQRELRCRTLATVRIEIAVAMSAYDVTRVVRTDTAAALSLHARRVSFSGSRDACIGFCDRFGSDLKR